MATRLGQQFNTLTMVNEIDRAILSALDTERVAGALLSRMHEILPCDSVSVTFLNVNGTQVARTYVAKALGAKQVVNSELTSQEVSRLSTVTRTVSPSLWILTFPTTCPLWQSRG